MLRVWTSTLGVLGLLFFSFLARAADVQVAVVANFEGPMQRIAAEFAKDTGHRAVLTTGATGNLLAQIESGAPFEVLLASDVAAPKKLEADGLAVPGSRFTYALGRLALWSVKAGYVDGTGAVLKTGTFQHLAIANPKVSPYGAAAIEALGALGLLDALRPKLVQGESTTQARQLVASGNAELGLVGLSQVAVPGAAPSGSYWIVPTHLYSPLQHGAVLLRKGETNPAARALYAYMKSAKAKEVIQAYGYALAP
jgi:molybdate transport system substrate-binding protein